MRRIVSLHPDRFKQRHQVGLGSFRYRVGNSFVLRPLPIKSSNSNSWRRSMALVSFSFLRAGLEGVRHIVRQEISRLLRSGTYHYCSGKEHLTLKRARPSRTYWSMTLFRLALDPQDPDVAIHIFGSGWTLLTQDVLVA